MKSLTGCATSDKNLSMDDLTYRAVLDGETYRLIGFYKWHLLLGRINKRPVRCGNCQQDFLPGHCVHHAQHYKNYFVCLACAKSMILKYGRRGFHVSILLNLQAADMMDGKYTAQEVADSLQLFHLSRDENGLEILTPFGEKP